MIRVAVTDDQEIILNGMQKILATSPAIELAGLYKNGESLLDGLQSDQPDVLLLDIQMPGQSGIELAGIITKKIKPNFKALGAKVGKDMKAVADVINSFTQEQIAEMEQNGSILILDTKYSILICSD